MSCTVIAVPYALMWVVGAVAAAAAATSTAYNNSDDNYNADIFHLTNENENCSENNIITEKHFIEKTFETPFMDKGILL